jgi:hypothetical protein
MLKWFIQHFPQLPLAVEHAEVGVEARFFYRTAALKAAGLVVLPELGERFGERGEAGVGIAVETVAPLEVLGIIGRDRVGVELLRDISGETGVVVGAEGVESRGVARARAETHAVESHDREPRIGARGPRRKRRTLAGFRAGERSEKLPARGPGPVAGNGVGVRHEFSPGEGVELWWSGKAKSSGSGGEMDDSTPGPLPAELRSPVDRAPLAGLHFDWMARLRRGRKG